MNKGNLKKVMREHVEEQSLSDNQLETLMQLQKEVAGNKKKAGFKPYRWVAIVAVFIMVMGNFFYFVVQPGLSLDQRIGNEVAKNHIKLKPLEISTSSMQAIRGFFTELDFLPMESSLLTGSGKNLIGGRYCSIQGVNAAQLRLKDSKTGQVHSLYQTIYDKDVFKGLPQLNENQKPITVYSKGLAVDIWVEKGLLFALTKENEQ